MLFDDHEAAHMPQEQDAQENTRYTEPIGHEEQAQWLLSMLAAGTLPQTLLFHGAKGIGKALFAQQTCCYILSGGDGQGSSGGLFGDIPPSLHVPAQSPTVARVLARSHADLLWIEPSVSGQNQTPIIKVDEARTVASFFSKTAGESARRIAVIDGADALTLGAANALLKVVEEPPINGLIILISHQAGKLLPTLLSRCRKLAFKAPSEADFLAILKPLISDSSPESLQSLYSLASGSVGRALQLHQLELVQAYALMLDLFDSYPQYSAAKITALIAQLEAHVKHGAWQPWSEMWLMLLERICLASVGASLNWESAHERQIIERLIAAKPDCSFWQSVHQASRHIIGQAHGLHLDRKQAIQSLALMAFNQLELAA